MDQPRKSGVDLSHPLRSRLSLLDEDDEPAIFSIHVYHPEIQSVSKTADRKRPLPLGETLMWTPSNQAPAMG